MQVDEVLRIDLPPVELEARSSQSNSFADGSRSSISCFVAGPENRLPILALEQLLTSEGEFASLGWGSPLLLVGPAGSGKTLLAQGIVRRWFPCLGEDRVTYFSAIDFARSLQTARTEGTLTEFRKRMRSLRMLVIEDLHKLPSSLAVQRDLRDLLDACEEINITVIGTSRIAPASQQQLEPGLRDRLSGSLLLWLNHPGSAARLELLKLVAVERGTQIDDRQLRTLAESASGPACQVIRGLIEWEIALKVGSNPDSCRSSFSAKEVIAVVARYFGLTQAALKGPTRRKTLVFARSIAVYLLRTLTSASYAQIGRALGNRDHSTIMHAMNSILKSLPSDSQTQKYVEDLRRILLAV